MLGRAPAGLVDVVGRGVLEVAGDGVQAQTTRCVRVGQPDPAARAEEPAYGWAWDERLQRVSRSEEASAYALLAKRVADQEVATRRLGGGHTSRRRSQSAT